MTGREIDGPRLLDRPQVLGSIGCDAQGCPAEHTDEAHLLAGANVLLGGVTVIATRSEVGR